MKFFYKIPKDLDIIVQYIKSLNKEVCVTVRDVKRSEEQSGFWYGYVDLIKDHTGYTKAQTKMILKKGVTQIGWVKMYSSVTTKTGIVVDEYISSGDLGKEDFSLLIKYTIQVCDFLNIVYKYDPVALAKELFK